MESYYKSRSEIRNVTFIFQKYKKKMKNEKNPYGFWKINKFIGNKKKMIGRLIIYRKSC